MIRVPNDIALKLKPSQVENLVRKLPIKTKLRLFQRLQKETWASQLDQVVQRMRSRVKQKGVTDKEIDGICEEVRKERYDKNQGRH